jgi:fumarate hydratase subunit alpha
LSAASGWRRHWRFDGHRQFIRKKGFSPFHDSHNPDPRYAALEEELLELVNQTGVGPQGLGGKTTALKVNIEWGPTHIGAMPFAVNLNCHAIRHVEAEI